MLLEQVFECKALASECQCAAVRHPGTV